MKMVKGEGGGERVKGRVKHDGGLTGGPGPLLDRGLGEAVSHLGSGGAQRARVQVVTLCPRYGGESLSNTRKCQYIESLEPSGLIDKFVSSTVLVAAAVAGRHIFFGNVGVRTQPGLYVAVDISMPVEDEPGSDEWNEAIACPALDALAAPTAA
ncbi:hypothetical protein BC827DRAFT_1380539 [Russula dissimulans]|nr:hypothetical protein BC827DRAFT_1380539 [Russula dissimulans]